MLEVLESPDHVVALKVSGTMDAADYDRIIGEVEAKLARHGRIGVLLDLAEFQDFTAEAAWKDIKYDVAKLGELHRFPREAIITDKAWMRVAAKMADPLFPRVQIRTFETSARDEAIDWVSGV